MKRLKISAIYENPEKFEGKTVTVCGWIRTSRDMKHFGFIELNDGSCFNSLQVVLNREELQAYDDVMAYNVGSSLICKGKLVLTPDAKQPFELKPRNYFGGRIPADYPLQKRGMA